MGMGSRSADRGRLAYDTDVGCLEVTALANIAAEVRDMRLGSEFKG